MTQSTLRRTLALLLLACSACGDGDSSASDAGAAVDAGDTSAGDDAAADTNPADVRIFAPLECPAPADASPEVFEVGGWRVTLGGDGAWAVAPPHDPDAPVLRGPGTCEIGGDGTLLYGVEIGAGEPGVYNDFGAFDIELVEDDNDMIDNAPDIRWSAPESAALVEVVEGAPRLVWQTATGEAALSFSTTVRRRTFTSGSPPRAPTPG